MLVTFSLSNIFAVHSICTDCGEWDFSIWSDDVFLRIITFYFLINALINVASRKLSPTFVRILFLGMNYYSFQHFHKHIDHMQTYATDPTIIIIVIVYVLRMANRVGLSAPLDIN